MSCDEVAEAHSLSSALQSTKIENHNGPKMCQKCGQEAAKVLTRSDLWCRDCFLAMFHHKFKSLLARCKQEDCPIKADERVLLCVSFGHSSRAMMHLAERSIALDERKRSFFRPHVLHIDYLDLLNLPSERKAALRQKVQDVLASSELPRDILCLNRDSPEWVEAEGDSEDDRLANAIYKTCFSFAQNNEFAKILTGETATHTVIGILQQTVKGQGRSIPSTVVPIKRVGEVHVRPMREFHAVECAKYNNFHKLEDIALPTFETKKDTFSSLNKLTEHFVLSLQEQQKNTVFTVLRASDKIKVKEGR